MAGASEAYNHLPSFYFGLFDLGYEAMSEVDARHEIVADWKEPEQIGRCGLLFAGGRVRGVLL